jgi:hypothetical protein
MFVLTTKVKVAAGIAAGVLTLGSAGAYAAANANNTISLSGSNPVTVTGGTTAAPSLVSLNGKTATINAANFTNPGQCVSTFAKDKSLVLAPTTGTTSVSKNYHGKLMAKIQSWCQQFQSTTGKGGAAQTETPDASQSSAPSTDSADTTDSGTLPAAASHAHGHGQ